jgi:uncharacterized membrane protein
MYLQVAVIGAVCVYCLTSAILSFLSLAAAFFLLRASPRRRATL